MTYYNENDRKCAAWLRELMRAGAIPAGHVDERSIADVKPTDLDGFTQCHFFAGIGGWAEALALAGWPEDRPVWTGSCPCQPFSGAGKRLGTKDARHLWPVFRRLVGRCRPAVVFGEQVASAAGREWLAGVRANLARLGYAVGAADLCAAGVGAPHIRQRLYWVAESDGQRPRVSTQALPARQSELGRGCVSGGVAFAGSQRAGRQHCGSGQGFEAVAERPSDQFGGSGCACGLGVAHRHGREKGGVPPMANGHGSSAVTNGSPRAWDGFDLIPCADGKARRIESGTFPLAHGVPGRVGLLRGYGNAIVPELAVQFIAAYLEVELTRP